jgi:methionyl-tRNA synthetase
MEQIIQMYGKEIVFLIMLWVLPWKGMALWKSAKRGDTKWFIVLLVVNSLAILDLLYLYVFSKKNQDELPK